MTLQQFAGGACNAIVNLQTLLTKPRLQRFLRLLAPWWVLLLIIGSLLPGAAKIFLGTTSLDEMSDPRPRPWSRHQLFHLGSFGSTALLFLLIANTRRQRLLGAAGVAALGLTLEAAQCLFYGSVFEWWDVRDDTYAVLVVLALFEAVVFFRWVAFSDRA